jgi:hypothetical protein
LNMASAGGFNTHYVYPSMTAADNFVQQNFGKLSEMSSEEIQSVAQTITEQSLTHPMNQQYLNSPTMQSQLAKGSTISMRNMDSIVADVIAYVNEPEKMSIDSPEDTLDNKMERELSALRMHR